MGGEKAAAADCRFAALSIAKSRAGRISAASPLGQALLNKKAGDKVRFKTPGGEHELTIVQVNYLAFGREAPPG